MLQDFRDNLKGTAVFIVVLISVPFALVGIDQIFQGGGSAQAELSVNGEDISKLEVDRALSIHKQRLLDQYESLNPSLLDDELLRGPVQYRLVREKAVSQRAIDGGMGVGKTVFSDLLKNAEAFQVDGRFDRDTYEFILGQMGHTQNTYFAALKDSMLISQMTAGVAGTGIVTRKEVEQTAGLIEQKRDYYYLTVPIAKIRETIAIPEEQVTKYYGENQQQFKTDEQVIVDYIELNVDNLISNVEIDEKLIREQFDAELSTRSETIRSRVEHILFANKDPAINKKRVAEVQEKLANGDLFGELAQAYSDDMGSALQGGDLGFVDLASFPPAFADAADKLAVGEVSAPLETENGIHLVRLAEKESLEPFTYDKERDRIHKALKQQVAEQSLPEKIDQLRELTYNAESLSEVGEQMGLDVKVSKPFSRLGGTDIAAFPVILKAAFDSEVISEGHASDVIELSPTRLVVLKLRELVAVRTLALDEVRNDIVERLTEEQGREFVETRGAKLLTRALGGEGIEEMAKQEGLPWQVSIDTRGFGGTVDSAIRDRAFAVPARSTLPQVMGFVSDAGDYVVLSLSKITSGDTGSFSSEKIDNLLSTIRANVAQREYNAYESSLVASSDIEGLN